MCTPTTDPTEPHAAEQQDAPNRPTGLHARKVRHALFTYEGPRGSQRVALRGQEIEIGDADLARGEEHGAFETDDEPLTVHTIVAEPATPDMIAEHPAGVGRPASTLTVSPLGTPGPARPGQNAPKRDWVDYAVAQGTDPAVAKRMSTQELIEARHPVV